MKAMRPNTLFGVSNPVMEVPLHTQLENEAMSPDSDYDETLTFAYSPSCMNRYFPTAQLDDIEEENDTERDRCERPYTAIYDPPVKFNSFQRKIFIADIEIKVQITDYERELTSHLLNPNLYIIKLTHGNFIWFIKRRYKDFTRLHQALLVFKASLVIPTKSNKEFRKSFRRKTVNKETLPRFPMKPEALVPVDKIPHRMCQLEKYLQNLLNIPLLRTHCDLINFLDVSNFSFISALGSEIGEKMVKKRTRCKLNLFSCICGQWQDRWLFVKESYFGLIRPQDGVVRNITLLDQGFEVNVGMQNTGIRKGLQVHTNSRKVVVKASSKREAKEWASYIKTIANTAQDFTSANPHNSYAPIRTGSLAGWFVDGSTFMSAVADALEGAKEEIFIADWWLTPQLYMKRPALDGDYWRLDKILLRKAIQGVKIFVLLYKEVEMAMGMNSLYTKQTLSGLHKNIKVMRRPDHAKVGVYLWAHHEKLVCIDQTYAFVGGIDLCYGRWDDNKHRLTDLGSISTTTSMTNLSKIHESNDSALLSLLNQSRDILQATACVENTSSPEITVTAPITVSSQNQRTSMDKTVNRPKSKTLMTRMSVLEGIASDEDSVDSNKLSPMELSGQAKLWVGKDYINFILTSFTGLDVLYTDLVDRTKTVRMPWHDVSSVIVGASARDAARHFIQRWNATKLEKERDSHSYPYLMPKSYSDFRIDPNFLKNKVKLKKVSCQMLRSASQWSCGFIDNETVEQSIHEAYIQSISKAEHYIYIEHQFFISMGFPDPVIKNQIADTIFSRIIRANRQNKVFRVYVVLPLLPNFHGDIVGATGNTQRVISHWNYSSICRGENSIIKRLLRAGIKNPKDYITFHSLRNHSMLNGFPVTELIYVHSKLMIIDDKTVIVGSANINDRSMIGKRDSEVDVIITDECFDDGKMNGETYPCGHFAGELRKYLFREHLGLLDSGDGEIDITDPTIESFYKDIWQQTSQNNSIAFEEIFRCTPSNSIKALADFKKYNQGPALCRTNLKEALKKLKQIDGFLVDFPLEFLSNEILTPPPTSKEGFMPTSLWT